MAFPAPSDVCAGGGLPGSGRPVDLSGCEEEGIVLLWQIIPESCNVHVILFPDTLWYGVPNNLLMSLSEPPVKPPPFQAKGIEGRSFVEAGVEEHTVVLDTLAIASGMRDTSCMRIAVQSSRNVVYTCHYHVVFCPKYRRKVLVGDVAEKLKVLLPEIVQRWGQEFVEAEVMPDHVHLLVGCDPQFGIHRLVKFVKGLPVTNYGKSSLLLSANYRLCGPTPTLLAPRAVSPWKSSSDTSRVRKASSHDEAGIPI